MRSRIVWSVYRAARGDKRAWAYYTRQIMIELGLEQEWETGQIGDLRKWRKKVRDRLQDREWRQWRKGMIGKVTLVRYRRIKTRLKRESFLKRSRTGVRRLVRLRAGVERLQIVRGRFRGVRREERFCLVCRSGEVEDEEHFIDRCKKLDDERERCGEKYMICCMVE